MSRALTGVCYRYARHGLPAFVPHFFPPGSLGPVHFEGPGFSSLVCPVDTIEVYHKSRTQSVYNDRTPLSSLSIPLFAPPDPDYFITLERNPPIVPRTYTPVNRLRSVRFFVFFSLPLSACNFDDSHGHLRD